MKETRIILASASPRRKELIASLDRKIEIIPSGAEETVDKNLAPEQVPMRLALLKARDVAKRNPGAVVIGCDTVVIIGGEILGKPKDRTDAKRMLCSLSGKTHTVVTGCALVCGDKQRIFSETSKVLFFERSDEEIERYLDLGEYRDKAGSYAIQGKAVLFVRSIRGDYPNIVGLPVARLSRELGSFLSEISL